MNDMIDGIAAQSDRETIDKQAAEIASLRKVLRNSEEEFRRRFEEAIDKKMAEGNKIIDQANECIKALNARVESHYWSNRWARAFRDGGEYKGHGLGNEDYRDSVDRVRKEDA